MDESREIMQQAVKDIQGYKAALEAKHKEFLSKSSSLGNGQTLKVAVLDFDKTIADINIGLTLSQVAMQAALHKSISIQTDAMKESSRRQRNLTRGIMVIGITSLIASLVNLFSN